MFCFLNADSDDEEEDEDVKTNFKPQVILEPKVGELFVKPYLEKHPGGGDSFI